MAASAFAAVSSSSKASVSLSRSSASAIFSPASTWPSMAARNSSSVSRSSSGGPSSSMSAITPARRSAISAAAVTPWPVSAYSWIAALASAQIASASSMNSSFGNDPVVDASVEITIGCSGESSPPQAARATATTRTTASTEIRRICPIARAR